MTSGIRVDLIQTIAFHYEAVNEEIRDCKARGNHDSSRDANASLEGCIVKL